MINSRGQMAEGIHMMYRLFMVSVVAFVVFSVGALSYNYYIDVRDVEARILAREVVECLAGDGVLNLDGISEEDKESIVGYCGISSTDRIYVGVDVLDSSGVVVDKLQEGDSGALWVRDLFSKVDGLTGNVVAGNTAKTIDRIVQYDPGYFLANYSVFFIDNGRKQAGNITVEVLINYGDK